MRDRANTIDSSHSDQIDDALNRTMSRATRRMSFNTQHHQQQAQGGAAGHVQSSAGQQGQAQLQGSTGDNGVGGSDELEKRITEETYPAGAGLVFGHDDEKDASGGNDNKGRTFGWVDVHHLEDFVASRRRSVYDVDTTKAEIMKGSGANVSESDLKLGSGLTTATATANNDNDGPRDETATEKIDAGQTRFTFFSSEAQTTIHSTGIGGLVRPGESFRDLFSMSRDGGVWWLDVVNPDKGELDAIAKAFSIHPLTAEDILTQENREKVELFKNYYFVCFRTFSSHTVAASYDSSNDIDSIISVNRGSNANGRRNNHNNNNHNHNGRNNSGSRNHSPAVSSSATAAESLPGINNTGVGNGEETKELLEPLNIYMVVFRGGILTFSFEKHTHAKNVRRRIGRLRDFVSLSSDWVCYAMIDDIVDSFGPVMRDIETESETIEDQVFTARIEDFALFLSQIGNLRKKVMGMMRLLGGKADVIRGFAKRCNEEYNVTPHGDIGLYLGDIQDHVVTMTTNLAHLEKMLSRSHGNYLASLSVKNIMVGNHVNRALTKITFIATILVPLNMISSLFGMNVKVPGQEVDSTQWFWGIVGLIIGIVMLSTSLARKFKLI